MQIRKKTYSTLEGFSQPNKSDFFFELYLLLPLFLLLKNAPKKTLGHIWAPKVATWDPEGMHAETFSMTFYNFVPKMQSGIEPRRLDRIRVLVPCFRPVNLLETSGGKAFSQDHPKGYLNWKF